jgi:hypothetical protein
MTWRREPTDEDDRDLWTRGPFGAQNPKPTPNPTYTTLRSGAGGRTSRGFVSIREAAVGILDDLPIYFFLRVLPWPGHGSGGAVCKEARRFSAPCGWGVLDSLRDLRHL